MSLSIISRGKELARHFRTDETNRRLPKDDQLKYISNPEFVWWKVTQKPITPRFIHKFKEPYDFLRALFTDEILDHICAMTEPLKFYHQTKKLTPDDLRRFIGQEVMRGYLGIRNIKNMWSSGEIEISYPGKSNSLSENHWFAISSHLNFEPQFVHAKLTGLYKLHLVPGYNVTIDEIRIPCHHEQCPVKNHNRDKPDIWAIESKSLHAENGYLVDFINPIANVVPTPKESVFQFANYLKTTERHHHLVMDSNFLSALDLASLSEMGFESTISCKDNRPSFIWRNGLARKLPTSYSRVASSKKLCCVATRNKGTPKIATTLCYAREAKGSFIVKERRQVLNIYDNLKGKADIFGHLYKAQYPTGHHKSWLTSLLIGWFYFTMTNAFLLYSTRFDALSHDKFVFQIAKDLMIK